MLLAILVTVGYIVLVRLVFFRLKLLQFNITWAVVAAIIGVHVLLIFLIVLRFVQQRSAGLAQKGAGPIEDAQKWAAQLQIAKAGLDEAQAEVAAPSTPCQLQFPVHWYWTKVQTFRRVHRVPSVASVRFGRSMRRVKGMPLACHGVRLERSRRG